MENMQNQRIHMYQKRRRTLIDSVKVYIAFSVQ
jgi:hypothetical protein